jgi:hypothetical protein
MSTTTDSVLLVGSVPLPTVEEVFRACAQSLREFASAYPDGEVGDRRYWTFYLPTRTYSVHPDLEAVSSPPDGRIQQPGPDASKEEWDRSWWTFRLRTGVTSLTFAGLGYADEARRSYEVFIRLRAEGELPPHARFQVSLPTTGSAVMNFFVEPRDWLIVYDAYRRAIRREVAEIAASIPSEDLVIQWDSATEVRDILLGDSPALTWSPGASVEEKWERHLGEMDQLSGAVPESVPLGYHFCFGTWGGWPAGTAQDMAVCVRLANEAVRRAGRRVDYVHMPVMPDADAEYFSPLQELAIGDTKVYLGIVLDDGVPAFERRAKAAQRYLPEFGIASYCGWGREEHTKLPRILGNLRACAVRFAEGDAAQTNTRAS